MKKVGLTGGIGSGKSTVASVFASMGVPVFEADREAAAYYRDVGFVSQVVSLLGADILLPGVQLEGEGRCGREMVDKRAIAAKVFADATLLSQLNALVHPRVMHDFDQFAERQQQAGAPYVIIESAILYESHLDVHLDAVVGVYLSLEERLQRTILRDKASAEQVRARMKRQGEQEALLQRADYIILNYEGNPRQRQVAFVHQQLLKD